MVNLFISIAPYPRLTMIFPLVYCRYLS